MEVSLAADTLPGRLWKSGQSITTHYCYVPYMDTYMVRGSFLPIHGPGDIHAARHGVNAEDLHRGLVGSHTCDAVPDGNVIVLVRSDLKDTRTKA